MTGDTVPLIEVNKRLPILPPLRHPREEPRDPEREERIRRALSEDVGWAAVGRYLASS